MDKLCEKFLQVRPACISYIKIRFVRPFICLSVRYGRSPEVASTPSHRLAFRSTEKPGRVRDGWAESAWATSAKGLDVQLCGYARQL